MPALPWRVYPCLPRNKPTALLIPCNCTTDTLCDILTLWAGAHGARAGMPEKSWAQSAAVAAGRGANNRGTRASAGRAGMHGLWHAVTRAVTERACRRNLPLVSSAWGLSTITQCAHAQRSWPRNRQLQRTRAAPAFTFTATCATFACIPAAYELQLPPVWSTSSGASRARHSAPPRDRRETVVSPTHQSVDSSGIDNSGHVRPRIVDACSMWPKRLRECSVSSRA